jgi:hypothetical protein
LRVVAHGDDEGKAELRRIGRVEALELGPLGVGQRVEPGRGLFGRRRLGQPPRLRKLAREVGMGREHPEAAVLRRRAEHARERVVQPRRGVVRGAEFQRPGAFRDPGRMLEDPP